MDSSTRCDYSALEFVDGISDSVLTSTTHKQFVCCKSITTEDTEGEEFGNTLADIQDIEKIMFGCTLDTKGGVFPQGEESVCEKLQSYQINSSTTANEKVLAKSATFPLSKNLADSDCTIGNDETHGMTCDGLFAVKSDKAVCTRSISLPTSTELVSAMKGSREKRGSLEKILTVKWAADVYDPPVTSMSHTVKGYSQHRSRSGKKNSKQKHKGKSSRSSSSEKKQYRKHVGNSEARSKSQSQLQSQSQSRGGSNEVYESSEAYLDYAVTGQESKCGSSFLRTSAGKVHMSFAEAT